MLTRERIDRARVPEGRGLTTRTSEGCPRYLSIEPQPWLRPRSEPDNTQHVAVRVHPRSIDAKFASESRRIDESAVVHHIAAPHELDHPQSDGLDPRGVDSPGWVQRRRAYLSLHTVNDPQPVKAASEFRNPRRTR
jgi:hypothetical protein